MHTGATVPGFTFVNRRACLGRHTNYRFEIKQRTIGRLPLCVHDITVDEAIEKDLGRSKCQVQKAESKQAPHSDNSGQRKYISKNR